MKIFLTGRHADADDLFMQVDDCDADLTKTLWGFSASNGYAYGRWPRLSDNRPRGAARVILERKLGRPLTKGEQPDHINHDKLDNRRENLRLATQAQNARNNRKRERHKGQPPTSQYKGVNLHRKSGRWHAQIYHNHKIYGLGYYTIEEEAARAYDAAARLYFDEFAYLNFPDQSDAP